MDVKREGSRVKVNTPTLLRFCCYTCNRVGKGVDENCFNNDLECVIWESG